MPSLFLRGHGLVAVAAVLTLTNAVRAGAQALPTEPIVFGDGRVTVAGDVSITYSCAWGATLSGCAPDEGYFNYGNYEDSLLRNLRLNVAAAVKATDRISVLSEVRSDNLHRPVPYALFVRVGLWPGRRVDLQAGRIPPAFGAFSRRPYPSDNILIGYPLAYQYLTSLRADALPATGDELLGMRGRGWLANYSLGNLAPAPGLPIVNGLVWDTGIQVHAATDLVQATAAVTTGTLAAPRVRDNNAGKQVSGRVALQPSPGLVLGASAARGPYASRSSATSAGLAADDTSLTQTAWEADIEYSLGHFLTRAEAILSTWRLPTIAVPLRARAASIEGRYRLRPGLYAAARFDWLGFSDIAATSGPRPWEAPVTRLEAGAGYSIRRNILLKVVYQRNHRDGGRIPVVSLGGAQMVYWF